MRYMRYCLQGGKEKGKIGGGVGGRGGRRKGGRRGKGRGRRGKRVRKTEVAIAIFPVEVKNAAK